MEDLLDRAPEEGVLIDGVKRALQAEYERLRQNLAFDIRDILNERKISLGEMARRLGYVHADVISELIHQRDLRLSALVALVAAMGGRVHILLQMPRLGRKGENTPDDDLPEIPVSVPVSPESKTAETEQ